MNAQQEKQQKGFTIIEVILVLAIAALIFLMVFIALPALQRGQRDTARKNDVGDIASAVTNFTSNNNGTFPTAAQLKTYVTSDVSGNTDLTHLTVNAAPTGSAAVKVGYVTVTKGTTCGATGAASNGTATQTLNTNNVASSSFTVTTFLESGGGTSFCQNS